MSDPRLTPDPALSTLREAVQIAQPVVDLLRKPDGPRDRQLIFGDAVTKHHEDKAWSYIQATKDGYCGFVRNASLGPHLTPTHKVAVPATHAYAAADFKSPDRVTLSFGSRVRVEAQVGKFAQTPLGFIPATHLAPLEVFASDPVDIAALFLGTPYLWGGNSRWGMDCSGLVQAALLACNIPCPGDSDMQIDLGTPATGGYRRNDLLFWKGHVALVADKNSLIHANAGTMSTTYEPIEAAIGRIQSQGDGPVIAHRRL